MISAEGILFLISGKTSLGSLSTGFLISPSMRQNGFPLKTTSLRLVSPVYLLYNFLN